MQAEYQSPESRTAAIEGSYSYPESVGRSLGDVVSGQTGFRRSFSVTGLLNGAVMWCWS